MKLHGFHIYQGEIPFDQLEIPPLPPEVEADYHWASNDRQIQCEYNGRVVAVCEKKIWGAGKTPQEAIAQAQQNPNCPELERLVLVDVFLLDRPDNGTRSPE